MIGESSSRMLQNYIDRELVGLSPLPDQLLHLCDMAKRNEATSSEIIRLTAGLPKASTKLLRFVNSSFVGLPREITSISHAMEVIGLHKVCTLYTAFVIQQELASPSERAAALQREVWLRSFAAASISCRLAKSRMLPPAASEAAFVGGLLANIGQIFLLNRFSASYMEVLRRASTVDEHLVDVENSLLGSDHAALGGELAERWGLVNPLPILISKHEDCMNAWESDSLMCVHVSDRVIDQLAGNDVLPQTSSLSEEAIQWLGMTEAELHAWKESVTERLAMAQFSLSEASLAA